MGFDGGKIIVKDFIKEVRPKQGLPAAPRYETKPGVQAQVDWGELGTIEVDGKIKKLFCFNIILGYLKPAKLGKSKPALTELKSNI